MNPLEALFIQPPRLLVRLLDDVHTLAQSAERIIVLGEKLDRRADAVLEMGERIAGLGEQIVGLGERVETMGAALDARGRQLYDLGKEVNEVGKQMLPEARLVHQRAQEVVQHANEVVAVLPTLQTAIDMALPLEGAVERLGRIVDRLPDRKRKKDVPVTPRSTKPTG